MSQLTIVIDTNIYSSQPNLRNSITNYRVGIAAAAGYSDIKLPFSDGQSIEFNNPIYNFLIVVASNPFDILITQCGNSLYLKNQNRIFTTTGPLDYFIITNIAGNGTNNIEVISA